MWSGLEQKTATGEFRLVCMTLQRPQEELDAAYRNTKLHLPQAIKDVIQENREWADKLNNEVKEAADSGAHYADAKLVAEVSWSRAPRSCWPSKLDWRGVQLSRIVRSGPSKDTHYEVCSSQGNTDKEYYA